MKRNLATIAVLSAALVVTSASSASARSHGWHHGRGFGPLGLIGAAIVGVATVATLPLVVLGDIASGPRRERDGRYADAPDGNYDGPGYQGDYQRGYPQAYRGYQDQRGDNGDDQSYQDRRRAYAEREAYAQQPPQGYYAPPPDARYPYRPGYGPPDYNAGPPPGYDGPPPGYDGPPPGYDGPPQE